MGAQPTASLQLTVSTIGVILGCLWIATNQLTTKRINYWQEQLALLEEISPEPHPIGVFSGEEYEKVFSRWTRFGNILFALALVTTVGWTALLGMAMRKIQEL